MEYTKLTRDDIISLITEFKAEIRKNLAKNEIFNEKINELTKLLDVQGKKRKPYPLSKWDKIVLEVVRENGKPATSRQIYDGAIKRAIAAGIAMDDEKMKAKINQCLVKLSGRRDDLKKMKYGGRGFAYAINA